MTSRSRHDEAARHYTLNVDELTASRTPNRRRPA